MAALSWKSGISGDWATAYDWSGNAVPLATDDVTINASGAYTITVSVGESAHSLTLNTAGADLDVVNRLNIGTTLVATAGTLELDSSGTLNGGTIIAGGATMQFDGGTLSGETWQGPLILGANASASAVNGLTLTGAIGTGPGTLALTGTNAAFTLYNGITMSGSVGSPATISVIGQGATLHTYGTTTLDNATLTLGNVAGAIAGAGDSLEVDSASTLTLGGGLSLIGVGTGTASVNYPSYFNQNGAIINNGTMTAGANGATLLIRTVPGYGGAMTFTNNGILAASNGGTLTVNSNSFVDNGAINVGTSSVAQLYAVGVFGTAAAIDIASGGVAHIYGSYSIAGSIAPTGAGELELDSGGTLNLGTLVAGGAAFDFAGGTLSGVTVRGPLLLGGTNEALTTTNGLTLTGTGGTGPGTLALTGTNAVLNVVNGFTSGGMPGTLATIDVTGQGATLTTSGTTTLDNATLTPRQQRRRDRRPCRQLGPDGVVDPDSRLRAEPAGRRQRHGGRGLQPQLLQSGRGDHQRGNHDRRRQRRDAAGTTNPELQRRQPDLHQRRHDGRRQRRYADDPA